MPEEGLLDLVEPFLGVGFLHVLDKRKEVVPLALELGAGVNLCGHHLVKEHFNGL